MRAQIREGRDTIDREFLIDLLMAQLERARHVPDTIAVVDRLIKLTGADREQQRPNRIPELLAAIRGALAEDGASQARS